MTHPALAFLAALGALGTALAAAPAHALDDELDVLREDIAVDARTTTLTIDTEVTAHALGTVTYLWVFSHGWEEVTVTVAGVPLVEDTANLPRDYVGYVRLFQLATPVPAGTDFAFTLRYGGTPDCGTFGQFECRNTATDTLLLSSARAPWYFDNLSSAVLGADVWTGAITVRAAASREVTAGQGTATGVTTEADGSRTHRFAYDIPTSTLAVFVRDGAPVRVDGDVPFLGFHGGDAAETANLERFLQTASLAWSFYEKTFGATGVNEVHIMTVPSGFPFGGMGYIGNIFIGEFVLGDYAYLIEQGAAHEMAHSWWGGLASGVGDDGFVHESLAEYSAWRALGAAKGDDERTTGVRMNSLWYMLGRTSEADIAVLDPALFDSPLAIYIAYHKTSTILRMLEEELGLETMDEVLRSFIEDGPMTLSIREIVARGGAAGGKDLTAFGAQWLERTGYPSVFVSASVERAGPGIGVGSAWDVGLQFDQIALEERGALAHDEIGTPFALTLPVRLTFANGTVRDERVTLAQATDNVGWSSAEPPIEVAIDPRWTALRIVHAKTPDVTLDGTIDAGDVMAVALRVGTAMPTTRRVDGHFDPLYDVDGDRAVDAADLAAVVRAIGP